MAYTPYTYTRCASATIRHQPGEQVPSAPENLRSVLNAAYKFPFKSMRQKDRYTSMHLPGLACQFSPDCGSERHLSAQ